MFMSFGINALNSQWSNFKKDLEIYIIGGILSMYLLYAQDVS